MESNSISCYAHCFLLQTLDETTDPERALRYHQKFECFQEVGESSRLSEPPPTEWAPRSTRPRVHTVKFWIIFLVRHESALQDGKITLLQLQSAGIGELS